MRAALLAMLCAGVAHAQMIAVPGGAFTMGSNDGPEDERPAHKVELAAFSIDRYPVTNAQFAEFLNAVGLRNARGERLFDADDSDARVHQRDTRWVADAGFEQHPVVEVSWPGARDYCAWRGARLPTEAQWEKAARGTDARRYPWGNTPPDRSRAQFGAAYNATAPVTGFAAGASLYGVEGMSGNVWQWVSSAYRPYPYRADDGREDLSVSVVRAARGGGHDWPADAITATHRGRTLSRAPQAGHHNIGFRCASALR